jgi:hypothetical protein
VPKPTTDTETQQYLLNNKIIVTSRRTLICLLRRFETAKTHIDMRMPLYTA